jgi:hypothetical protein
MHAVIRSYSGSGAKELFELMETRKDEVESVIGVVTGFVSYTAVQTDDGGISVTICQDKAGTDESVEAARNWIAENAADLGPRRASRKAR